jgi:hypothetical protein
VTRSTSLLFLVKYAAQAMGATAAPFAWAAGGWEAVGVLALIPALGGLGAALRAPRRPSLEPARGDAHKQPPGPPLWYPPEDLLDFRHDAVGSRALIHYRGVPLQQVSGRWGVVLAALRAPEQNLLHLEAEGNPLATPLMVRRTLGAVPESDAVLLVQIEEEKRPPQLYLLGSGDLVMSRSSRQARRGP